MNKGVGEVLAWNTAALVGGFKSGEPFQNVLFSFNGALGVSIGLALGDIIADDLGAAIGSLALPGLIGGKVDELLLMMSSAGFVVYFIVKHQNNKVDVQ